MSAERKNEKNERKSDKTLTLRLMRSGICTPKDQKATLRSLGLRRMGQQVERPDDPSIRGMVLKVRHLVEIVKG
ncbi:MAG: 50S ribosomal protein L30 [Acidobacteriota bacterium]|nr:50S ribosomal protein L30 [Acidobacteriota bacterium]